MTNDEAEIVRRFQEGGAGSFDDLYSQFSGRVHRFCRRLTPTISDAEDLTQEVFVAAFTGREKFAGRCSITTWLLRIAVFRWHAMKRTRRPDVVGSIDDHAHPAGNDPADHGVVRLGLAYALEQLPSDQREAFLLVRAEGLTCREAADVLRIPEGTLKFRVYRAASKLQELLIEPTAAWPSAAKKGATT